MKAISAGKKKGDKLDARKVTDIIRCNLLPVCWVAPKGIRELRSMLRYRSLVVGQTTQMKNRMSGLLMENGAEYNKQRLHGAKYFTTLLEGGLEEVPESVKELLKMSRSAVEAFAAVQQGLVMRLQQDPLLAHRVMLLKSIRGVGDVTALTWVLEIGDPHRFSSISKAVSYCGLTSAHVESAGKTRRGPISKLRNSHLQRVLIEAAKMAPRWNPQLKEVYERELPAGDCNRATLEVARKLVSYLLAVDKSGKAFEIRTQVNAGKEELTAA